MEMERVSEIFTKCKTTSVFASLTIGMLEYWNNGFLGCWCNGLLEECI